MAVKTCSRRTHPMFCKLATVAGFGEKKLFLFHEAAYNKNRSIFPYQMSHLGYQSTKVEFPFWPNAIPTVMHTEIKHKSVMISFVPLWSDP